MAYEVEFTEEFRLWYEDRLSVDEQKSVKLAVWRLESAGPNLGHPYSSGIKGSKFSHMRELRIEYNGRPY